MSEDINSFKKELEEELKENILPFWINKMQDYGNGGFYGCINGKGDVIENAPKGSVLNSRILWTVLESRWQEARLLIL